MNVLRRMVFVLLAGMMITGGILGWRWLMKVPVREVQMRGLHNTPAEAVSELMALETKRTLFRLDRRILEDRIMRYPWVAEASVTRIPTGLMTVRVRERAPVARVLLEGGRPGYYMDRAGAMMPALDSIFYDVPLISELDEPYHPVRPVGNASILELLDVLPTLPPETDALISEIEWSPEGIALHLSPAGNHSSIRVELGKDGYGAKMRQLQAFWDQQVLRRQDTRFAFIDLRFDGQIVTREH